MISTSQTSHLDSIDSFLAMEVFAKAQALEDQGRDIIHLEFGEPDFTAPPAAAESVKKVWNLMMLDIPFLKVWRC